MVRRLLSRGALLGACGSFLVLASCGRQRDTDPWLLHRNLLEAGSIEVSSLGALDDSTVGGRLGGTRVVRALKDLEARGDFRIEPMHSAPIAYGRVPHVVVGAVTDPRAQDLLEPLIGSGGLALTPEGFRFAGRPFVGAGDVLIATYEDPERPGLPLTIYAGNDAASAAAMVGDLTPAWRPAFRCFRDGELDLRGELTPPGSIVSVEDIGSARRETQRGYRKVSWRGFMLSVPRRFVVEDHTDYLERAHEVRRLVLRLVAPRDARSRMLEVRWIEEPEPLRLASSEWRLSSINPLTHEVTLLDPTAWFDDGGAAIGQATALQAAGPPAQTWLLDAVGAFAADRWWGRPMDEWIAHLHGSGLTPPLRVLLDASTRESPHLVIPLRGRLLRYLHLARGEEFVRALWTGEESLVATPYLRKGFLEWLDRTCAPHGEALARRREQRLAAARGGEFRKGVALCDDPGGPGSYGSAETARMLRSVERLGANAMSLTVLDYADPGLPDWSGAGRDRGRLASAADLELAVCIRRGADLGMRAMLQPHSLVERSGNWAGWSGIGSKDDWTRYFRNYRRLVVHYGLLAELTGCEIFCIGTGVKLATFTRRQAGHEWEWDLLAWKLEEWRSVVSRARGAFTGALTYSASWRNQIPDIQFWGELDFVGGMIYGPLTDPVTVRPVGDLGHVWREDLTRSLSRLAQVGEENERPVLACEVGLPASEAGWNEPWKARGPEDPGLQARMYRALKEAIVAVSRRRPELRGVYLWQWNTDDGDEGSRGRAFAPRDRPAETVVRQMFNKL